MTLPTDIILPRLIDYQTESRKDEYFSDLIFDLQTMYEQIAQNVNGYIRSDAQVDADQWLPILKGTSTAGAWTYTHQYGNSIRSGIMTEVWYDIQWSATTATGNLYLELPYQVCKANGMQFVGECQSSDVTFTTGDNIQINAIPSTYRGEFWNSGSGLPMGNQAVVASGRLVGHLRYFGTSDG